MRKLLSLILLFFLFQSCNPVYKISNTTSDNKIIIIGMNVHKEIDAEYSVKTVEEAKNVVIINKNRYKHDNYNHLNYKIEIPPKEDMILSKLIFAQLLTSKYNHDSMDIRLSSGQPIFIDSDSIKVNNFRLVFLPWKRVYYYIIR